MTTKTKKKNYINNKALLEEVLKSKEQDQLTDNLCTMFQLLVSRYAGKGNWSGFTFRDEMESYAVFKLVETWRGFNPERSHNPFAFFTQCIKNSFRQYIKYEKNQRNTRDALLVKQGLTPSFNYQLEHSSKNVEDEEDFYQVKEQAQQLQNNE